MLLGGGDGRGTKDRIKKIVDPNILIPCNLVNLTIFDGVPFVLIGWGGRTCRMRNSKSVPSNISKSNDQNIYDLNEKR